MYCFASPLPMTSEASNDMKDNFPKCAFKMAGDMHN